MGAGLNEARTMTRSTLWVASLLRVSSPNYSDSEVEEQDGFVHIHQKHVMLPSVEKQGALLPSIEFEQGGSKGENGEQNDLLFIFTDSDQVVVSTCRHTTKPINVVIVGAQDLNQVQ
jgi:hypothetical protein